MPSLTATGADSTNALASFKPRPVAPRTALIAATLLPPADFSITSNSVFSSAAASPPAAGPAATATAADASTPNFSSAASINSTSSITGISAIAFKISSLVRAITRNSWVLNVKN
ncbi:50S ribosomal protein L7/L12 [Idiomarina xiamenensis 10-D-4]|uniref:50S ribosomal protein L7/L12 n=1 Tax=Idiomarina xiamenensis 10-D-4 TaxID=740709 RepID=K2K8R8_9GAMM|nr:50S ribosomal protein L7/L12 [Idiomarina xiamenensis 10-D-4]